MRCSGRAVPRGLAAVAVLLGLGAAADPLPAQEEDGDEIQVRIRESEERLAEIREERERLQREMESLEGRVSTASEDLRNLRRQIGSSASLISELDLQIRSLGEDVDRITGEMLRTRDALTVRKTELRQRLRAVYKRGGLEAVRVLLSADSFADLINRYKYLHLVTLYDRMLVRQVSRLEERLEDQRLSVSMEYERIMTLRTERQEELQNLEALESRHRERLATYRTQVSRAESRDADLVRELENLRGLVAELERTRREAERRAGRSTTSSLRTADLGNLSWPVEGEIVYRFGLERQDGNTTQRDGVGIGAARGTPVRAVESGEVRWAGSQGLYGPSVIVSHGGGYYSAYLYLQDLRVRSGDRIEAGQAVGSVGGVSSREGPHIEFQIHEPGSDASGGPRPVDPIRWLRDRS